MEDSASRKVGKKMCGKSEMLACKRSCKHPKNFPPSMVSERRYEIRVSDTYSPLCSGAYCAATIISLLDLPLALPHDAKKAREAGFETLTDGLAEYLSRCKSLLLLTGPSFRVFLTNLLLFYLGQSFEGGISGSPGVEAHGAYAFCALACLSMLGPPEETIPRYA